jgi:hypothetical protein
VAPVRVHDSGLYYVRVPIGHWGLRNHHGCHALLLVELVDDHHWHRCVPEIDHSLADQAGIVPMRFRFTIHDLLWLTVVAAVLNKSPRGSVRVLN